MKKREELCQRLNKRMANISSEPKTVQQIQTQLKNKYDIPIDVSGDYLTLRNNITDASDFLLFVLTEELMENELKGYFTPTELKNYRKEKFKIKKLKFPIRYKMVQVADDQWVGKITAQELMLLRDAQVINYNERTQRTMERVVINGTEHYRIALNRKAIEAIQQSFNSNIYIPNTLTLNLPPEAKYEYDSDEEELVIYQSDGFQFDILDGYHRYIGISHLFNLNNSFDYNMELRIVQFDENKAKQFIWQEDQKTKMKRVDSESMNVTAIPNKVIARLNADPTFNLAGQISPNEGIINSGEFYLALNSLYQDKIKKKSNELQTVLSLTEKHKDFINYITVEEPRFLKKWDRKLTVAVMYAIYKGTSKQNAIQIIGRYLQVLDEHPKLFGKHQRNMYNSQDFRTLSELA